MGCCEDQSQQSSIRNGDTMEWIILRSIEPDVTSRHRDGMVAVAEL